jgi:flagellar motor protein MotB
MNDWLVLLLQIGGTGAVIAVALFIIGKWLLNQITTALKSYVTAYAQQTANIDARMANLEKLAEEQARLTRTVEGIKDDIAAQAKSRDNQWAFKKDVYTNLITTTTDISSVLSKHLHLESSLSAQGIPSPSRDAALTKQLSEDSGVLSTLVTAFVRYANLAPLATADSVTPLVLESAVRFNEFFAGNPNAALLTSVITNFNSLRERLQAAGRKDLWGTPEPEAKAEPTTKG